MKKNTLLTILVIALFLLNLFLLASIYWGKPGLPPEHFGPPPQPEEVLVHKLRFSPDQADAFRVLKRTHGEQIQPLKDALHQGHRDFFGLLKKDAVNQAEKDSILEKIAQLQTNINRTHFEHFMDIKQLCTEDQLKYYNDFIGEMSRRIMQPPPPDRPGPNK